MRFKTFIIVILLVSFTVISKETKVPKAVKESFAKLYPKVKDAKWEMEEKNKYEAEFNDNNKNVTVVFNKKGKIIETETSVPNSELPPNINKVIKEKYVGLKLGDASMIVDKKGIITYLIDIITDHSKIEVLFDKDGKFLNEVHQEKDETDKDED